MSYLFYSMLIWFVVAVLFLIANWWDNYPIMLRRRGRLRPHWTTWADAVCWPVWGLAALLGLLGGGFMTAAMWLANRADDCMIWVDKVGEGTMNPVFDVLDPPLQPKRGHDDGIKDHD